MPETTWTWCPSCGSGPQASHGRCQDAFHHTTEGLSEQRCFCCDGPSCHAYLCDDCVNAEQAEGFGMSGSEPRTYDALNSLGVSRHTSRPHPEALVHAYSLHDRCRKADCTHSFHQGREGLVRVRMEAGNGQVTMVEVRKEPVMENGIEAPNGQVQSTSEEPVTVVKKGTQLVELSFQRMARGLKVSCKAHPSLEAYMKELSGNNPGEPRPVASPIWLDAPEKVYLMPAGVTLTNANQLPYFRMDRWGGPLEMDSYINFSFLRAVGISEGVSFVVKGVYSAVKIKELAEAYRQGVANFYGDFMRPVCVKIAVSVVE